MPPQLMLLPPVPPPIGLYLRPGWNDHVVLQQVVVEEHAPTGIVFEARFGSRHRELLDRTISAGLDAVLDPGIQELWSPAGRSLSGLGSLPWSWVSDESEPALRGEGGRRLAALLAQVMAEDGYGAVLSPTHYLRGPWDPNLAVDVHLARNLRTNLNHRGLTESRIYFTVAMPALSLARPESRRQLTDLLSGLDADAIWLLLHPFGSSRAGPNALRRYIEICVDFQELGLPIVAERTGTVGLALLAMNVVGGIECGVTVGEGFDAARLTTRRPESEDAFSSPGRVYIPALGAFVSRAEARSLLARRTTKAALGCRDSNCCRRGPDDMVRDPKRHGAIQRIHDVEEIGSTPPQRRRVQYLDHLTNAGNLAVRLSAAHPSLESARKRLDSWRGTLSAFPVADLPDAAPLAALGRRVHAAPRTVQLRPLSHTN